VSVVVIGLNHRAVPLDLFERVHLHGRRLSKALYDLKSRDNVNEVVIVSTCNRHEVYLSVERIHAAFGEVRDSISNMSGLDPDEIADHLQVRYGDEAIRHLLSVSCGLDSAVLGESEVLGQVRRAWKHACAESACGPELDLIFRHSVETGKRARTETQIARGTASISHAAVEMAGKYIGSIADKRVLVIGAGEMAEGMANSLRLAGSSQTLVANRTRDHAVDLAGRIRGEVVEFSQLPEALVHVDLVLASTGAPDHLLDGDEVDKIMTRRQGRPLLIVDVAVPRDIDPSAGSIAGVTLLNIDDLRRFAQSGVDARHNEVAKVQTILDEEVARVLAASSARGAAPLLRALRGHAEELRAAELERYESRLSTLDADQKEAVQALTKALVAKLLHQPTVAIREAAGSPDGDSLAESASHMFGLDGRIE